MADEKKTYLINVESNLDKYSQEAAEAKKKVDELKVSNDALKESGTATAAEIEANNAALRNAQKEYKQAQKMVDLQTAANKSEIGSRKQLGEILKLQEQELGKLGKAYVTNAQGVRTLNPLYIEQRKRIAETKQAIIDYDQSLNDGRSNIGRYGEAVSSAFKDAGKSILSMLSPMALVAAGIAVAKKVFDGLKEAIMSTGKAMDQLNIYGQITKQMFYDIATSGKLSAEAMQKAAEVAALMNDKRRGDRQDIVQFALLERQIAMAELEAADKTKTHADNMDALNKAIRLQNELSDKKIAAAREDLAITEELMKIRPKDEKLRDQYAKDLVVIINLDKERYEQSKRNESRATGFMQEEIDKRKSMMDAWYKEIEDNNDKQVKAAQDLKDRKHKQEVDEDKEAQSFIDAEISRMDKEAEAKWNSEMDLQQKIFEQNRKAGQAEWDARIAQEEALAKAVLEIQEASLNARMNLANSVVNLLGVLAGENKALQNAALIAEKSFAIADIIIQTTKANATIRLMAAMSVPPGPGYLARLGVAMATAMVPINLNRIAAAMDIAAIIAATASGIAGNAKSNIPGSPAGSMSASSAAPVAITTQRYTTIPVGSSILTQPQLSQTQLNAIPNQNLLTAQDIANALSKMPAPVVTVEDINAKAASKKKVEVRANI